STLASILKSISRSRPVRSCGHKLEQYQLSLATTCSLEGATTRTSALRHSWEALRSRSGESRCWKRDDSSKAITPTREDQMKRTLTLGGIATALAVTGAVGYGQRGAVIFADSHTASFKAMMPGVSSSLIWGDTVKGPFAGFTKFAPGFDAGMHSHTSDVLLVVVNGNRLATLGPSRAVRIPKGGLAYDATGKFLIPGLWDMHVHAAWSSTLPTFGPLFLVNGVTGVREMWGSLDVVAGAHISLAQHHLTEPRFVASGQVLDGSPPIWEGSIGLASAEQARRVVDSLHAAGADFIKVYNLLPRDVYTAIVAEAKRLDMPVVGHVPVAVGALAASKAGQRSIEHLTDLLLSCSTHETALRAALVAAFEKPRDSLRALGRRQQPDLLDTYS